MRGHTIHVCVGSCVMCVHARCTCPCVCEGVRVCVFVCVRFVRVHVFVNVCESACVCLGNGVTLLFSALLRVECLPPELLQLILSFLDVASLFRVRRVCRTLCNVVPIAW